MKTRRGVVLVPVAIALGCGGLSAATPAGAISPTSVSPGQPTLASTTAGASTSYSVPFTVASDLPASGTITLAAPAGTNFPGCSSNCASLYAVSVSNGHAAAVASAVVSSGSGNTHNQVVLTLGPSTIAAGDAVTLTTRETSNPVTAGSTYRITESTSTDPAPVESPIYTVTAGPPVAISVSAGDDQSARAGSAYPDPLVVAVTDVYGNPVSGATVEFAVPATGPSGTFGPCPADPTSPPPPSTECFVPTDGSGLAASSTLTASATSGSFHATATVNAVNSPASTSFTLTNTAVPPSSVVPGSVTVSNSQAAAGGVTYTIGFTTTNPLPVGGSITLVAPNGTAFPATTCQLLGGCPGYSLAYGNTTDTLASVTVAAVTGPGSGSPSSTDNRVTVAIGGLLATPIPGGSPVTLTISGAGNPDLASPAYAVEESTSADPGVVPSHPYSIKPGPASQLVVGDGDSQSATVGTQFAAPLEVIVEDAAGNPVGADGAQVSFSISPGPGGAAATFGNGTAAEVDSPGPDGTVTSSYLTANAIAGGPFPVEANLVGHGSAITFSLTNQPGPPAQMTIGATSTSATVGMAYASPFTATVTDQDGNPVPGVGVQFEAPAGAGTFASNQSPVETDATDSTGTATSSIFTAGPTAETFSLTVSTSGPPAQDVTLTNTPGAPSAISVQSGDDQSATVGQPFGAPLVAVVTDAHGNPVDTACNVTFAAPAGGASGTFTGNQASETDASSNGVATSSTYTANSTAGTDVVTASSCTGATALFRLTNVPDTASVTLSVQAGNDQDTPAGQAFAQPLVVRVHDPYGNPLAGEQVVFTAPAHGPTATFGPDGSSSDTATTGSDGLATTTTLKAGHTTGSFEVTAQLAGQQDSPTVAFDLVDTPGPPSITVVSGGGQTAHVGRPFGARLQVRLTDQYGNAEGGVPVTFALPASGATGEFPGMDASVTVTSDASGVASAPALAAGKVPGPYSVTVSAPGAGPATIDLTNTDGYWLAGADGSVQSFGDAKNYGSLAGMKLNKPIVGTAPAPGGNGYWLVASDGGVFAFGPGAHFYGSTGAMRLNQPIVGMAADPVTGGYWLVAADGGVFSFNAPFFGSTGGIHLSKPIVGMAAAPGGDGYWLVASDGGLFSFGPAARFYGSTGGIHLDQPVVGMAAAPGGDGYWLVASDGGVFSFGPGAPFYGSTGAIRLAQPIVGMAASAYGNGYWFVAADGGVFSFGPGGRFYGSGSGSGESVVAMGEA